TMVNVHGGPSAANTAALNRALAGFPDAEVKTRDQFKHDQINQLQTLLNIVYALLGLSVIVSLFGIVNTLVLSVFERTRELGMLRAIGMTRRQVRRMIRHESIVTALIGATFGIAIGLFLAVLVTRALSDEGFVFAVPYTSLAAFVVVAILAGILAAVLPARPNPGACETRSSTNDRTGGAAAPSPPPRHRAHRSVASPGCRLPHPAKRVWRRSFA